MSRINRKIYIKEREGWGGRGGSASWTTGAAVKGESEKGGKTIVRLFRNHVWCRC